MRDSRARAGQSAQPAAQFRVESCKRSRLRARPAGSVGVSQGEMLSVVRRCDAEDDAPMIEMCRRLRH